MDAETELIFTRDRPMRQWRIAFTSFLWSEKGRMESASVVFASFLDEADCLTAFDRVRRGPVNRLMGRCFAGRF